MINHSTSLICFISIMLCLFRTSDGSGSWVHGTSHNDDDANEKMNKNPHHLLKDLKKNENLHLTSLLQDDLSYLEDVMMEKERQNEIFNRILYGGEKTTNNGGSAYESQHRYLEDGVEEEDMLSPPTCIAPDVMMTSNNSTSANTTNANITGNLGPTLPEATNFTGILLLEMVGRPTTISDNETEIMELVILATYQNLSICEQSGIVRQIYKVEIIPDIFGFSPRGGRNEVPEDDTETDTTTTTTDDEDEEDRRHRHNRRLLWEHGDNDEHHTILWKTPNEYFEWNRRRYESHRYLQQQQQQGTGNRNNNTANNNTANNNTANTGGGGGGNALRPVTQPFNWLVRLTGTCNGCALQPSLFDDISNTPFQRQRRNLLHSQFHTETTNDNKNNKDKIMTSYNKKHDNTPPIRGGGGGGGKSRRTLMENETDTSIETNTNTSTVEICNCPGPKSELFQQVLNDTIYQLVDEGIIQSIDIIDDTPELIPTSPTTCGGGGRGGGQADDDGDEESPLLQKFSASLVLTLKACPNQFLQADEEKDPTVLSPLEVLALAYQKSFNELNLLNGDRTCDPFARRLTDATAMLEENPDDILFEAEDACIGDNIPYISIRLNLEAECLGCEGILFEPEDVPEDDEDLGSGTRQLLRKLKGGDKDEKPNPYSDLFPFCFCPKGTPSRGIKASELFELFNTTLDIFQQEGRGGNEFVDVEVAEVSDVAAEPSCGNGILDLPEEECDDGNTIDGDSCTNNCTLAICGDGILTLDGSEECDDGNGIDTDECTNGCRLVINNSTNNSTNITIPPTMSNSSNITDFPSKTPSMIPSMSPSMTPSTSSPTTSPSVIPSTTFPSVTPTMTPSKFPSTVPSDDPSSEPSMSPTTAAPSGFPTPPPTQSPSNFPTTSPSWFPSVHDDCLGISCGSGGTCIDEVDTYSCICNIGYENSDQTDTTSPCVDIDECLRLGSPHFLDGIPDPYPCPPNHKCDNTEGSFTCTNEGSGGINGACLEEGDSPNVDHDLNNRQYCNNICSYPQIRKLECEGLERYSPEFCQCITEDVPNMLQNDCDWPTGNRWCDIKDQVIIEKCDLIFRNDYCDDCSDICGGGTCSNLATGGYECSCDNDGYVLERCVLDCSGISATGNSFTCITNPECSRNIVSTDESICIDPCLNICPNGECTMSDTGATGYTCICNIGYEFHAASNSCVSKCDSSPCGDGATCFLDADQGQGFRCDCPTDDYFNGDTCVASDGQCNSMTAADIDSLVLCPSSWPNDPIWHNACGMGINPSDIVCRDVGNAGLCCWYTCPNEFPRVQNYCKEPCPAGYELDTTLNNCVSKCDDEPCGPNGVGCFLDPDQEQGYRCDCLLPDSYFDGITCVSNPCNDPSICVGGTCTNNIAAGTYDCSCNNGFVLERCVSACTESSATENSSECITDPDCSRNLVLTDGSSSTCIDPCDDALNICPANSVCTHKLFTTGYACTCNAGYVNTATQNCVSICNTSPCGPHGVGCSLEDSSDFPQGYGCTCQTDYYFDGISCVPNQCNGISTEAELDNLGLAECPTNWNFPCINGEQASNSECIDVGSQSQCCWYTCPSDALPQYKNCKKPCPTQGFYFDGTNCVQNLCYDISTAAFINLDVDNCPVPFPSCDNGALFQECSDVPDTDGFCCGYACPLDADPQYQNCKLVPQ